VLLINFQQRLLHCTLIAVSLTPLLACAPSSNKDAERELSHIRLITSLYVRAASQLRHNPKDEAEFKQAIASSDVKLENLRVNAIDELFVSERDGKPLVVIYGAQLPASGVIVYEQEGVNGLREVGYALGKVAEVDAAEFAKLVPNANN